MSKHFILILFLFIISACGGGGNSSNPNAYVPPAAIVRADLYYGYFGSLANQPSETEGHVNIFYDLGFDGPEKRIENIKYMGLKNSNSVIGLDYVLWNNNGLANEKTRFTEAPDAEVRLTALLQSFKDADILKYIQAASILDEVDNREIPEALVKKQIDLTKKVFANFNVPIKILGIYGAKFTWVGSQYLDWVGFDNYSAGAAIFYNGDYARFKGILKPHQKGVLVPGGAEPWLQDPAAFINTANADAQIIWIMPFTWFTSGAGSDFGKGIRDNSRRKDYCNAGAIISQKKDAKC